MHDVLHDHLHLHVQYWKRHFIFVSVQILKRSNLIKKLFSTFVRFQFFKIFLPKWRKNILLFLGFHVSNFRHHLWLGLQTEKKKIKICSLHYIITFDFLMFVKLLYLYTLCFFIKCKQNKNIYWKVPKPFFSPIVWIDFS